MTDLQALKARIRSLLAKTVASGCTEGEAIAAAEKAFALMREHGIAEEHLGIVEAKAPLGRKAMTILDNLWGSVAARCRCVSLISTDPVTRRIVLLFIGPDPWPEVAAWLQGTLTAAHQRALDAYRKSPAYTRRRTPRTRAAAQREFTMGFVQGVASTLRQIADDPEERSRALRLANDAAKASYGPLGSAKGVASKPSRATDRDREAGYRDGRSTPVSWGIRADSTPLALTHHRSGDTDHG